MVPKWGGGWHFPRYPAGHGLWDLKIRTKWAKSLKPPFCSSDKYGPSAMGADPTQRYSR